MHMFLANGLSVPFSGLFSGPFLMLLNRPPGRPGIWPLARLRPRLVPQLPLRGAWVNSEVDRAIHASNCEFSVDPRPKPGILKKFQFRWVGEDMSKRNKRYIYYTLDHPIYNDRQYRVTKHLVDLRLVTVFSFVPSAIQPKQVVYSSNNFQKSSHNNVVLRGAVSPCTM